MPPTLSQGTGKSEGKGKAEGDGKGGSTFFNTQAQSNSGEKGGKDKGKGAGKNGFCVQCYSCGERGHRQLQCPKWIKVSKTPSEDLEEVQQFGSVLTVACVEEKAPVKVADEDEELEAPPGLEMQETTPPQKYSVCSVTQKIKLELTTDNGAEESVWPISPLKETLTLSILGKK